MTLLLQHSDMLPKFISLIELNIMIKMILLSISSSCVLIPYETLVIKQKLLLPFCAVFAAWEHILFIHIYKYFALYESYVSSHITCNYQYVGYKYLWCVILLFANEPGLQHTYSN